MIPFTTLSDTQIKGRISSTVQGLMIGSMPIMPEASARVKGCVVKYTGEDSPQFKKYLDYICTDNGDGTYSWQPMDGGMQTKVVQSTRAPTPSDGRDGDLWIQV